MTASDPDRPVPAETALRVSALIAAAQEHLERFGDTHVGVVMNGVDDRDVLHIEDALKAGRDKYEEDGEWVFEVEARTEERCPVARGAATAAAEAPDTATVLAGLREEMTALAARPWMTGSAYIALVEAAQQRLAAPVVEVPPRVLAAEARRDFRDLLARGSLGCRCGHMLADHDADYWDEDGDPVNRACMVAGCDCGHDEGEGT